MARSAYCSFPNLEFARSANTTLLLLKVPNSDLNTKKSKIVIFWGPANTALLLLKVPKHGSQTGSLDMFQNHFRELGVTKKMSICTSYLPDNRQTTDRQHMTHNDFWDLYTIGPSGKDRAHLLTHIFFPKKISSLKKFKNPIFHFAQNHQKTCFPAFLSPEPRFGTIF